MASWSLPVARLLVVVFCLGLSAPRGAADDTGRGLLLDRLTVRRALAQVAADGGEATATQPEKSADPKAKKPFLKTTRGILLVSLTAVVLGFTLYSTSHDRVQSPIR